MNIHASILDKLTRIDGGRWVPRKNSQRLEYTTNKWWWVERFIDCDDDDAECHIRDLVLPAAELLGRFCACVNIEEPPPLDGHRDTARSAK